MTRFKKLVSGLLVCVMVFSFHTNVYAANKYMFTSGNAGSTYVEARVGFNENVGYAEVSALQDVDARMSGQFHFWNNGATDDAFFYTGFDQKTCGGISIQCKGNVFGANCNLNVYSVDGEFYDYFEIY